MAIELLKGNVAFAEAAIRAGCDAYFGYPITPQTEALEHMAARMPELGRVFVQAESEVAAIHMVYGAAAAGARAMTSSSSPGVSLMMEGISYMAGSEVPAVLVDVMRGGPGLGNIAPAQSDYFQMVKGGGHGDYRSIVLAPSTVQELIDHTVLAFDLAERYRTLVVVLADGSLGQMMEGAELPPMRAPRPAAERPDWALTGAEGATDPADLLDPPRPRGRRGLQRPPAGQVRGASRPPRCGSRSTGSTTPGSRWSPSGPSARLAKTAIADARDEGIAVGLLRPITLDPYPVDALRALADRVDGVLVVEMNAGQMLQDVQRIVAERVPVRFFGRTGGVDAAARGDPGRAPRVRARTRRRPRRRRTLERRRGGARMNAVALPTTPVYERPDALTDVPTHYCPGCTHGIAHRLIAEVIDEMGIRDTHDRRRLGRLLGVRLPLLRHRLRRRRPTGARRRWPPASSASPPTGSCSPTRATATWRRSAPPRSCTRPCAASTSPSSSSTTPSTA